jgi:hypothetical protein
MKQLLVIVCLLVIHSHALSQHPNYAFKELRQLDSISKSPGISRHFGGLYFHFLQLVEKRLVNADTTTQRLVRNFEAVFAGLYIDAARAWNNHEPIALHAWQAYFADTGLSPIQYKLLGANAHLNGGLSAAIAGSYTPSEWKYLKKKYVLFNKCLNKTYRQVYDEVLSSIPRARTLHGLSLGIDRIAGSYYLYKWRKRQMRLAQYGFTHSSRYKKFLDKISRKKDRIDQLVLTQLYR